MTDMLNKGGYNNPCRPGYGGMDQNMLFFLLLIIICCGGGGFGGGCR